MITMDTEGMMSYPAPISCRYDSGEYWIGSAEELKLFVATAFSQVNKYITTGRRLKIAIEACPTVAAADKLQDIREFNTLPFMDYLVEIDQYIEANKHIEGDSSVQDG